MNKMGAFETGVADNFIALSVFPEREDHAVLKNIFPFLRPAALPRFHVGIERPARPWMKRCQSWKGAVFL